MSPSIASYQLRRQRDTDPKFAKIESPKSFLLRGKRKGRALLLLSVIYMNKPNPAATTASNPPAVSTFSTLAPPDAVLVAALPLALPVPLAVATPLETAVAEETFSLVALLGRVEVLLATMKVVVP